MRLWSRNALTKLATANDTSRITGDNVQGINVLHDHRARTDNRTTTDGDSRTDEGLGAYENAVIDRYRRFQQRQGWIVQVVSPGTDVRPV